MAELTPSGGTTSGWPSLRRQLADVHAPADSPLEKLIIENQDVELLHPSEVDDAVPYPLWLRVRWRKAHPEEYPAGVAVVYPMMLERVLEWMEHNPDKVDPTLDARDDNDAGPSAGERSN